MGDMSEKVPVRGGCRGKMGSTSGLRSLLGSPKDRETLRVDPVSGRRIPGTRTKEGRRVLVDPYKYY